MDQTAYLLAASIFTELFATLSELYTTNTRNVEQVNICRKLLLYALAFKFQFSSSNISKCMKKKYIYFSILPTKYIWSSKSSKLQSKYCGQEELSLGKFDPWKRFCGTFIWGRNINPSTFSFSTSRCL